MRTFAWADAALVADTIRAGEHDVDWAVVDVRDSDYVGGHIPHAHHVPSSTFAQNVTTLVQQLQDVKCVIFHCALSQERGPSAARRYVEERQSLTKCSGDDDTQVVWVLRRGFCGWIAEPGFKSDPKLVVKYSASIWE